MDLLMISGDNQRHKRYKASKNLLVFGITDNFSGKHRWTDQGATQRSTRPARNKNAKG